ncbi:nucleotide exchange factor GrpE [Mycoplasma sp. Ms02]|uniref:nucleotide exchange factor GrpE n=1 Tax=Mycoplasma sp. Ms02 TaxID=353851 RepID=UPI001C89DF1F|nr:nucleotide exchange factor GrpE [Mycoplasma sp. Ms02]QZE12533.1 nucleotide exchange factor GrpE [Mycoplasma sp. Ms02]
MKIELKDVLKAKFEVYNQFETLVEELSGEKELVIGEDQFLEEFDEKLIGLKVKEKLEIDHNLKMHGSAGDVMSMLVHVVISDIKLTKAKHEKTEASVKDLQKQIKELEEQNAKLQAQNAQMQLESQIQAQAYKSKAAELAQKAKKELEASIAQKQELMDQEKANVKAFALQSFTEDFLVPYANFLLATKAAKSTDNPVLNNYIIGFEMIDRQFRSVLDQHGIEIIEPQQGEEFNPENHFAIDIQNDSNFEDNKIIKMNNYGFKLNGRLVKPAQVVVNKFSK